jgi:uncharacterized small protein (DUF1192 family)
MAPTHLLRKSLLLAAMAAAGAVADPALAQSATEQELESRVAQLEKQIAELVAELKAQKPAPAVAAAPGAPPPPPPIQATTITPNANAGTKFFFSGFMRTDALSSNTDGGEIPDSSAGRDLYVPGGIPVGSPDEGTDLDAHIKFSRYIFGVDHTTDTGDKLSARLEGDIFGGALGTEVATNTTGLTVRHAWLSYNNWLFGQTWSNFMDPAALPEAVDLVGPTEGTVFVRQPMVRYTSGAWSFSLENPETTITPFRGGARIQTDDNSLPDFTARYRWTQPWGHLTAGVLVRQLAYETVGTGAIDDSRSAIAGSFSGRYNFNPNNDIRFAVYAGQGIGRYIGLGVASDAVLDANGDLEALDGLVGFVGFRHAFSPKVRANIYYATSSYDNEVALTGTGVTKSVDSLSLNMFYTPTPKLDLGAELRFANRELKSGAEGELKRLHLVARYSF